jgi:hypothetical protein
MNNDSTNALSNFVFISFAGSFLVFRSVLRDREIEIFITDFQFAQPKPSRICIVVLLKVCDTKQIATLAETADSHSVAVVGKTTWMMHTTLAALPKLSIEVLRFSIEVLRHTQ